MAILHFKDNIHKDTNVLGYNTYQGNGQGCGTIWFKNVPIARKALFLIGEITGADLFDCDLCQCRYSINEMGYRRFKPHMCKVVKEKYARLFEKKLPLI